MSEVEVKLTEIPADQNPHSKLTFAKDGEEVSVTMTLEFEGEWKKFFGDQDADENDARHAFAGELFLAVTQLFA